MSELPDHILRAIRSGTTPVIRDWRSLPVSELTRAERNMAFVERHCVVPEGTLVGQSLHLADFQEAFYYAIYDNVVMTYEAYLSIARKNAKTGTIATIVLVHLVGPEAELNSEIMSGARSREQASQVFRYASKMVKLSERLSEIIRIIPSSKMLIGLPRNVEYKAGAAEASTSIGGSPKLAIMDELGQIRGPRDEYVDAIITAQGAHENPLLIGISTQAATDSDLWSKWLDDAEQGEDQGIVSHLYEIPADADVFDEAWWVYANPAIGLFRSKLDVERRAQKAERMPSFHNTFRNLYCNQRVDLSDPFVSVDVWKANGTEPEEHPGAAPVWAGLDLSMRTDLTAFVMVWQSEGQWQVRPYFWAPEQGVRDRAQKDQVPYDMWAQQGYLHLTPGATVDYKFVAEQLGEILDGVNVQAIAYDRWRIDDFKRQLDEIGLGLPLEPFGQGYRDMSPALDAVEAELLNHRVAHGMQPLLGMCATNAIVTTDPSGNRKLDKSKSTRRIDGMVAFAMAMGQAARTPETVRTHSVYEQGTI